jgi:DNA polymerase III delta prime subunit
MKFLNVHYDDYIYDEKKNLHENIKYCHDIKINDLNNIIFYGPPGCGKYTQCLNLIKNYSPSKLKYDKKLLHTFNKQVFNFKISDIHIEIDMSLLGCNAKILWNEIYNKILDITFTKSNGCFIIVCTNFHQIHSELLENFYSYMQTFHQDSIKLKFILITEELSFINNNIINRCEIISVPRPTKSKYSKIIKNINSNSLQKINNIKDIIVDNNSIKYHENICNYIVNEIINSNNKLNYAVFRDILYDLLILNMDIHESIWYIVKELFNKKLLSNQQITKIIKKMYIFFQYYNNNYRPIYHLESFLLYLISEVHEL